MDKFKFSKTYKIAVATHNTLAKTEKFVVLVAIGITTAKVIAACVVDKTSN